MLPTTGINITAFDRKVDKGVPTTGINITAFDRKVDKGWKDIVQSISIVCFLHNIFLFLDIFYNLCQWICPLFREREPLNCYIPVHVGITVGKTVCKTLHTKLKSIYVSVYQIKSNKYFKVEYL